MVQCALRSGRLQSRQSTCANDPGHDARAVRAGARQHTIRVEHLDSGQGLHGHETKHHSIRQPIDVVFSATDQFQEIDEDLKGNLDVLAVAEHAWHHPQGFCNETRLQIQARKRQPTMLGYSAIDHIHPMCLYLHLNRQRLASEILWHAADRWTCVCRPMTRLVQLDPNNQPANVLLSRSASRQSHRQGSDIHLGIEP